VNDNPGKIMVFVAGVKYEGRQKLLKKMYLKTALNKKIIAKLKRDKHNIHDKFAVKIFFDGQHVGYIPKKISSLVYRSIRKKLIKKVRLHDIHMFGDSYGATIMLHY